MAATVTRRSLVRKSGRNVELPAGDTLQVSTCTYAELLAFTGMVAGALAFVTDVGLNGGSMWRYGSSWKPVGGSILHFQKFGSVASPLATITGSTAAFFSIAGGDPAFPANLLGANSRVRVNPWFRKRGANATVTLNVRIGTSDSISDLLLVGAGILIGDGSCYRGFADATFSSSTIYVASGNTLPNQPNGSTVLADRSTNIDVTAVMYCSISISGGNASDSYDLIGLSVEVWP